MLLKFSIFLTNRDPFTGFKGVSSKCLKKGKENQLIIIGRQFQKVRKDVMCYKLTERERKKGSEVNRKKELGKNLNVSALTENLR